MVGLEEFCSGCGAWIPSRQNILEVMTLASRPSPLATQHPKYDGAHTCTTQQHIIKTLSCKTSTLLEDRSQGGETIKHYRTSKSKRPLRSPPWWIASAKCSPCWCSALYIDGAGVVSGSSGAGWAGLAEHWAPLDSAGQSQPQLAPVLSRVQSAVSRGTQSTQHSSTAHIAVCSHYTLQSLDTQGSAVQCAAAAGSANTSVQCGVCDGSQSQGIISEVTS